MGFLPRSRPVHLSSMRLRYRVLKGTEPITKVTGSAILDDSLSRRGVAVACRSCGSSLPLYPGRRHEAGGTGGRVAHQKERPFVVDGSSPISYRFMRRGRSKACLLRYGVARNLKSQPYEETNDQLRVIAEIKRDMESRKSWIALSAMSVSEDGSVFSSMFKCVMEEAAALLHPQVVRQMFVICVKGSAPFPMVRELAVYRSRGSSILKSS